MIKKLRALLFVLAITPLLYGCPTDILSGLVNGACIGNNGIDAIYCYDGYDQAECDYYNTIDYNGAAPYTFYPLDDCVDHSLSYGINPY